MSIFTKKLPSRLAKSVVFSTAVGITIFASRLYDQAFESGSILLVLGVWLLVIVVLLIFGGKFLDFLDPK